MAQSNNSSHEQSRLVNISLNLNGSALQDQKIGGKGILKPMGSISFRENSVRFQQAKEDSDDKNSGAPKQLTQSQRSNQSSGFISHDDSKEGAMQNSGEKSHEKHSVEEENNSDQLAMSQQPSLSQNDSMEGERASMALSILQDSNDSFIEFRDFMNNQKQSIEFSNDRLNLPSANEEVLGVKKDKKKKK